MLLQQLAWWKHVLTIVSVCEKLESFFLYLSCICCLLYSHQIASRIHFIVESRDEGGFSLTTAQWVSKTHPPLSEKGEAAVICNKVACRQTMLMIRNVYLRIAIYDPARDGTRGSRRWGHAAVSFWMNAGRGLSEWSSCVYDRKYRLIDSVQHLGRRFTSCEPPNVDLTILISNAVVQGSGQMIWHFSGAINANGMWNSICLKVFSILFFCKLEILRASHQPHSDRVTTLHLNAPNHGSIHHVSRQITMKKRGPIKSSLTYICKEFFPEQFALRW